MMNIPKVATRIVNELLNDMSDRRGFRQNWEAIDDNIQRDIKNEWRWLAAEVLREELANADPA